MSLSSSNKQIKEMRSDAFSELPDSLLIHILSFLDVKSAGITSVLSKRWKYLWAESPNLVFLGNEVTCWGTDHALNFASWVNRTIAIRQGNYLERFVVDLVSECSASDVDDWVEFSVKNNVKELVLSIYSPRNTSYTPPQVIYSCSSLTTLNLLECSMTYEGTIAWQCLTSLTLYGVMLNQHLVDEILSNCPLLNDLELRLCWGFDRLEVNSQCLNSLTIEEFEIDPFVEISAPCMHFLSIAVFSQGKKWQLRNISSVVSASIDFLEGGDGSEEVMVNVKEFLENFKHINDLHIHYLFFEVCISALSFINILLLYHSFSTCLNGLNAFS